MTVQKRRLTVEQLNWCYREAQPKGAEDRLPIVLLHGILCQSFGWQPLLPLLAAQGHRAIAPDWLGFGLSDQPDASEFAYTSQAFIKAFSGFVDGLGLKQFSLVVQGFVGSIGLQYLAQNRDRIDRLVILNAPFFTAAKLPWKLQQLGLPLIGEMLTQDPLCVDRTLEGGGGKIVSESDLEVYRNPYLRSSKAGRSLLATVRNLQLRDSMRETEAVLANWRQPSLVLWGEKDAWLPVELAERAARSLPKAEFKRIAGAGHYPQLDEPEAVGEIVAPFFRRQVF
ncbi:alpha/beta fold hydrolase [Synechococcus sp. PCC 7336]|uniref:alpha/beta fold hydrolase n=1 Tax=Synechococcus sp. PCC 7336 TaxID=195250 RepID=UPI00036C9EE2|nr:alpha/beta fold hydrolase [Synechococcus sp. PCC 7336]